MSTAVPRRKDRTQEWESSTNYNVIKNNTCREALSLGALKYNDITFTDVPFIT